MSTRTYRGRHHRRPGRARSVAAIAAIAAVSLIAAEPMSPAAPQAMAAPDPALPALPAQVVVAGPSLAGGMSILPRMIDRASRSAQRPRVRPIRRLVAVRVRTARADRTRIVRRSNTHRRMHVRARAGRAFGMAAIAVDFALAQVGDAYVWSASGPNAWDCSGLVVGAYGRAGVELPHQSMAILGSSHIRRIGRSELRRGDLVWPQPGHIAIYLGHGRIVHAANPREGVRVAPLYAFWTAGRVS